MRGLILTGLAAALALTAGAQVSDAGDYRVCSYEMSQEGQQAVATSCPLPDRPDYFGVQYDTAGEMEAGRARLFAYRSQVSAYGTCVSDFIGAASRTGESTQSEAANKAACAHSWAENQLTETLIEFGEACIDFANRSVQDPRMTPWDGECFALPETD